MKISHIFTVLLLLLFASCTTHDLDDKDSVIIQKITKNNGMNNAFTDLVFFDNQFFLVYRESDKHANGRNGVIKMCNSLDGERWSFLKEFSVDGIDLRDPKFSVNGNQLNLYIHGVKYQDKKILAFNDYSLSYSSGWVNMVNVTLDNKQPNTLKIQGNEAWPWRVTWYENKAYSVGYNGAEIFDLYQSDNGLFFKNIKSFRNITKSPTEATVRVSDEGVFYILARRNYGNAILGKSDQPEGNWDWFDEIPIYNFGGPNFLLLDQKHLLIAGRELDTQIVGLYDLENKKYKKLLTLKSGGDCSYPGMVLKDGFLWLSYYSSHENIKESSIYVAKIKLKDFSL